MAVETSAVQITINVVDGNSGAAVGQVTKNIEGMGMAGATSGAKVAKGMDTAGVGALSAVERMRLVTEEAGVRLPRALIRLAAESKLASAAINSIGTGLVVIGAVQIGAMLAGQLYEGAKKFYEKWLDVDGAIEKYNKEAADAASKRFDENRSLEDLNLDLAKANEQLDHLNQKRADSPEWWEEMMGGAAPGYALVGAPPSAPYFNMQDAGNLNKAQGQSDDAQLRILDETHKKNLQQIDDIKIESEAKAEGIRRAKIEQDAADKTADEKQRFRVAEATKLAEIANRGKSPDDPEYRIVRPDAGITDTELAKAHAASEFKAHSIDIEKQKSQELARLREEALEAQLHGSALYHAQEAFAIEDLKRRGIGGAGVVDAVRAKFHAEEMKRLEEQTRATEKIVQASAMAGMTGIAKSRREGEGRIADIHDSDFLDVDATGRSALADKQRAAASHETDAQIGEERRSLTDYVNQLSDQSAAHQISGFARINAEALKQFDELKRKIEAGYGKAPKIGPASTDQAEGAHLLQLGTAGINQNADQQRAELRQRDADETAQIELEARSKSLSAEKQQTLAIESEYEQRTHKYKEELDAQIAGGKLAKEDLLALNDDYNRRVIAAGELRDGQMVEAAKAAREKMAGEFTSLFKSLDHPMEALKGLGEKAAGEAAAAMVQRMQSHFGGGTGAASAPTGQGLMDSLMGRIAGHPGAPGAGRAHAGTSELSSVKAISLGTAEIHIQSASVAFGGAGAAGSSSRTPGALGAAGAVPGIAGGSTELLMPGSAFNAPTGTGSSTSAPQGFGGGFSASSGTTGTGTGGGEYAETQNATAPGQFDKNGNFQSAGTTGGAGAVSAASAPSNFAAGSPGAAPAQRNVAGAVMGDLKQGWGLVKQGASIFGEGKARTGTGSDGGYAETQNASVPGQFDKNGDFVPSGSTNGGMLGGGGVGANAMDAANGALGMVGAYEGNGGVGGAASGAMSGMQLGMALGGPLGAGIGAAAGAVIGAIGPGGREKARVYDLKQVRPRIGDDIDGFQHAGDYLTAYADVQSLDQDAKKATNAMGPAAQSYYQDIIKKEIKSAEAKLTAEQRAGRSQEGVTKAQYDWGGPVDNFGAFGDGPTHGMIRAQRGEYVVEQQAANTHAGALNAINSGATPSDMARYYGGGGGYTMPAQSGFGGDIHIHGSMVDPRGFEKLLEGSKHKLRSVINSSYSENSGAADA
jgi:hypothetical protein